MNRLEQLRLEIKDIDRGLIEHVARRLDLAVQIGREKMKEGMAVRDWTIEKQVIDRAEQTAGELNLPVDLVRSIMQLLIRESCATQEEIRDSIFNGDLGRIVIVGGKGKMGQWFARFFHNQGHFVSIFDPGGFVPGFPSFQSLGDGIRDASLILLATPLEETPRIYEELIRLNPTGIICDIASLKSGLLDSIRRAGEARLRVVSIHPLFGPETRLLSDKVICLCRCGDDDSTSTVRRLFEETSVRLVELPLERHDLLASYVLGLSHIINIVFARTLLLSGLPCREFTDVSSTTFLHQMATTRSVIAENPFLYYEIQNTNRFTPELYDRLRAALDEVTSAVLAEDRDRFVSIMEEGKTYCTTTEKPFGPEPEETGT